MPHPKRRNLTRWALLTIALTAAVTVTPAPSAAPAPTSPSHAISAAEVRLRKLHLVRPDLIPYPIAYDVVC